MFARLFRFILPLLFLLAWAGCDTVAPDDTVQPEIRLTFVQPVVLSDTDAAKAPASPLRPDATYTLELTVRDAATGEDFSPPPATVDDADGEARFTLSLSPGAFYTFEVRYAEGTTTVAEGGALWLVDRTTSIVDIPIVPIAPAASTVGFLPGRVVTRATGGTVDLTLRYYGNGAPIVGLACVLGVTGIDPATLTWTGPNGPDLTLPGGQQLEAAWRWDTPVSGELDLATLTVPLNQAADLQLAFLQGDLRVVDAGGTITPLQAVGADIDINP